MDLSPSFFLDAGCEFLVFRIQRDFTMAQYDDCIVFLLGKAYQKAHGNFKKHVLQYGLTPIQHLILEALWEEEGISAGEIGKRLVLDGATLSGVMERMADRGWIVKETDAEDKRFLRIYLSERARELRPELVREREQANEEILAALSLEEKILLKRLLRDVQG
jgi:DNA-binding MarR family transcriptional regulator